MGIVEPKSRQLLWTVGRLRRQIVSSFEPYSGVFGVIRIVTAYKTSAAGQTVYNNPSQQTITVSGAPASTKVLVGMTANGHAPPPSVQLTRDNEARWFWGIVAGMLLLLVPTLL